MFKEKAMSFEQAKREFKADGIDLDKIKTIEEFEAALDARLVEIANDITARTGHDGVKIIQKFLEDSRNMVKKGP